MTVCLPASSRHLHCLCQAAQDRIRWVPLQVIEFVAFQQRLQQSHSLAAVKAERLNSACLRFMADSKRQEGKQGFKAALAAAGGFQGAVRLRFNQDLNTRPCWLPPVSGQLPLAQLQAWAQLGDACMPGQTLRPTLDVEMASVTATSFAVTGGAHQYAWRLIVFCLPAGALAAANLTAYPSKLRGQQNSLGIVAGLLRGSTAACSMLR